jgi:hypothetical protein
MITCDHTSAANESVRPSPANGGWLPCGKPSEASSKEGKLSRRNVDETIDAPVSNVSPTILVRDLHRLPLSARNGSEFSASRRKNFIGARPAPNVFPSNVFGRRCSMALPTSRS